MSDLAEYFSDKERIKELEKQVRLLQQNNSKWKSKYYAISKSTPRESRTSKARELVKAWQGGDKSLTLRQIGDSLWLQYSTIKTISSQLRHPAQ